MRKLVLVLLLLGVLVSAVAAQPFGQGKNREDRWDRGDGFEKAKDLFNETRKKVEEVRQEAQEKRFEAWKNHLLAWVEMAKRWTERVEMRVENMNLGEESKQRLMMKLQNIEERLNEIESKISNAENYSELQQVAREVRTTWSSLRMEMRQVLHSYIVEKYKEVLERLIQLRDRLEASTDVSKLDDKISEIESALNELENYAGTAEFSEKVREVNKLFRDAFEIVKELVRQMRAEERAFVYAHVNGSFTLSGNFTSVQIKGNGTLNIPNEAVVTSVDNKGVRMVVAKGSFTASGEGDFRILAHGSGELKMSGKGYYRVKPTPYSPLSEEREFENATVTFG